MNVWDNICNFAKNTVYLYVLIIYSQQTKVIVRVLKQIFMAVFSAITCACSSEYVCEPVLEDGSRDSNFLTEDYDVADEDELAFAAFMESLDSLNLAYSDSILPVSRGAGGDVGKEVAVCAADAVGAKAGQFGGKWLGSVLCAGSGNPVVVAMGYFGGRKVGGLVGFAVASALTRYALDKYTLELSLGNTIDFDADCSIKPSVIQ